MSERPTETRRPGSPLNWDPIRLAPYYTMFFLWSLGTGAQQLARPLFAAELGASAFFVVVITASNALAHLVSAPLTGFLSDHIGRKPLVLIGNGVRGVTLVGQFFAESYIHFLLLEFIGGIGVAMWSTSSSVAMADFTTRENRGRLMAVRSITSRVGMLAGPLTGALILVSFHDNLRYVFLFNAVTKVFIHVLVHFFASETAPEENRRGAHASGIEKSKLDLRMFMTKAFAALVITSFTMHMMGQTGAYGALFPVQAKNEVGMSAAEVGQVLSIAGFIGLFMAYPAGWAIDRIGRKPMMIPGLCLLAGAAFVLANLDSTQQVYVMIVLYGLGNSLSQGGAQAFVIDLAPQDRRGTYMGVWTLVGNMGGIIAPLVIGAIATNFGYAPGYLVVVVMLVTSALVMLVWGPETGGRRRERVTPPPEAPAPVEAGTQAEASRRVEV